MTNKIRTFVHFVELMVVSSINLANKEEESLLPSLSLIMLTAGSEIQISRSGKCRITIPMTARQNLITLSLAHVYEVTVILTSLC